MSEKGNEIKQKKNLRVDASEDSPIIPTKFSLDSKLKFRCHPGVSCFTKCCSDIDILLTPYDVLRMKNALNMGSSAFLSKYTAHKIEERSGNPRLFLTMEDNEERSCPFVTGDGCTIYQDRPAMCRYYPVGQAVHRREKDGELINEEFYVLISEEHCKGFEEDKEWTFAEWRDDQDAELYDNMNSEWKEFFVRQSILSQEIDEKKQAMFYMASYDIDMFRRYVLESRFLEVFDVDNDEIERIKADEVELMKFAFKYLKFFFGMEAQLKVQEETLDEYRSRDKE